MEDILNKYRLLCGKYHEMEQDFGEQAIHDKRVALRRIFSILSLYNISLSKVNHGKEVFKMFGKLRDIQVQLLKLDNESEKEELREYIGYLHKLEKKYTEKATRFSHEKPVVFPEITGEMITLAEIKAEVEKRLQTVIEKTEQLKNKNAKRIHKVRIEFTKLRYALENLAAIDKTYEAKLKALKKYQDFLGDIQDAEVLLKGVTKFYGNEKAPYIEMLQINKASIIEKFIEEKSNFVEVCREAI